jgi:hypothetical protein
MPRICGLRLKISTGERIGSPVCAFFQQLAKSRPIFRELPGGGVQKTSPPFAFRAKAEIRIRRFGQNFRLSSHFALAQPQLFRS